MQRSGVRRTQIGTLASAARLALLLAVLCGARVAGAVVQVDQENAGASAGAFQIQSNQAIGQEFVPDFSEHLGVEVLLVDTNDFDTAPTITLNLRQDSIVGSILASVMATPLPLGGGATEGFVSLDFASPVFLTTGQTYVIELVSSTTRGAWAYTTGDAYADGEAFLSGSLLGAGIDFGFRTIINTPEPSPVLLLGMGLLALAARPATARRSRA